MAGRQSRRVLVACAGFVAASAGIGGLLLVAWVVVEAVAVREFRPLLLGYGLAALGVGLAGTALGERQILRQVLEVAAAVPLFLTAPVLRHRQLHWGATPDEVGRELPGDALVTGARLIATRAITIDAAPDDVLPWVLQMGAGRAGFYSYDLLDNRGRPSAETLLPEWQGLHVGDFVAPMTKPPAATSFVIAELEAPDVTVWTQPQTSCAWVLRPLPYRRTRLIVRLRQRSRRSPVALLTAVLLAFGEFPMTRKMLLGIKARAERLQLERLGQTPPHGVHAPGRHRRPARSRTAQLEGIRR